MVAAELTPLLTREAESGRFTDFFGAGRAGELVSVCAGEERIGAEGVFAGDEKDTSRAEPVFDSSA
jgi:hypothetical protein